MHDDGDDDDDEEDDKSDKVDDEYGLGIVMVKMMLATGLVSMMTCGRHHHRHRQRHIHRHRHHRRVHHRHHDLLHRHHIVVVIITAVVAAALVVVTDTDRCADVSDGVCCAACALARFCVAVLDISARIRAFVKPACWPESARLSWCRDWYGRDRWPIGTVICSVLRILECGQ